MYYCHKAGTSRWDTAGPEALLISQGGELTDIKGTSYSYDGEEKGNIRGVVATINKTLHKQTIDRYG
jgi:3'-phosphoadenosine 5'-phosphosulfate (PAPS) 3'-phosphatase